MGILRIETSIGLFIIAMFLWFLAAMSCGGFGICGNLKCRLTWYRFTAIGLIIVGIVGLIIQR